jgi:hypothetical protein
MQLYSFDKNEINLSKYWLLPPNPLSLIKIKSSSMNLRFKVIVTKDSEVSLQF